MQFICLRSVGQMTMPDHVCEGQTMHYFVNPGQVSGSTYTWWIDGNVVPGYNTNEFVHTWNSSGNYLLEVQERSASGCMGPKRSGLISVNPQPLIQISVSDTVVCSVESVAISVENPVFLTWGKWIFDLIVEPEAGITGNTVNGTYSSPADFSETLFNNGKEMNKLVYRFMPVIVDDDGDRACEGKEARITVWVHPRFRCQEGFLEIPNAFSPNRDGINDVWNIIGKDFYPDIEVTIYNRWGQVVWKSARGYPVSWDGRSRGMALPIDSYHYFIELQGRSKPLIGTVTIVR